ncbi:hypothetical protein Fmac_010192 [Flemingia macrophylla]|uniref:Uncharacterized protein n=1 Tax=Flemingia macrophylla TaxID=520843 RepID=A0ABD1N2C7_9FABA
MGEKTLVQNIRVQYPTKKKNIGREERSESPRYINYRYKSHLLIYINFWGMSDSGSH